MLRLWNRFARMRATSCWRENPSCSQSAASASIPGLRTMKQPAQASRWRRRCSAKTPAGAVISRRQSPLPASKKLKHAGDFIIVDLRSIALQGLCPRRPIRAGNRKALLFWHERHRFCSNCGKPTTSAQAGWRRDCVACGANHFPRTDPCVIMLAIHGEQCLLGRQTRFPPGMWSALAGFVEPGESLEEAVRRETLEEAGIPAGRVAYFASQPWPFPMSIMIGAFAEAKSDKLKIDEVELEAARWVTKDECRLLLTGKHPARFFAPPPLAIAHHLIKTFVERGAGVFD
ncbi:MAG: NAD(+) diphosphatase [Rhizobiales bacterium]|nr:NAD(+) diphosphatase [Hyphomicrobiales bacterium]